MGCANAKQIDKDESELVEAKRTAEANKLIVRQFFDEVLCSKNIEPINQYVNEKQYIQHNPSIPDGREAVKAAFKAWWSSPAGDYKLEMVHIGAERDLVFVHSKMVGSDGTVTAVVDLFRLANGQIVEHWDVIQPVPADATNPHPMF